MHFIIHTTDMLPDSILLGGYQTIPWVKMLTWLLILLARVLANVLGIHLGRMEMRIATAMFFRGCRGAKLAASATPESMTVVDSFVAGVPRDRRLEISLVGSSDKQA